MAHKEKSENSENGKSTKSTEHGLSPTTKLAAGVAAAGGAGLLAATVLGVGPVAIAGAAGYLAYKGMTGQNPFAQ